MIKKKRQDFINRALSLASRLEEGEMEDRVILDGRTEGEIMASKMILEIVKNTKERFESQGRDFYFEKI